MRTVPCAATLATALLLAGCGGAGPAPSPSTAAQQPTPAATPAPPDPGERPTDEAPVPEPVGDVVVGLAAPWSVLVLDDDTALVSQRDDGRILLLRRDGGSWSTSTAGRVPEAVHDNEGGLLGLALAPSGSAVYAMYTASQDNRVAALPWDGSSLGAPQPILTGVPRAAIHNGGRIAFGPDGMLYVATGDAGRPALAQDRGSLAGKILRIAPEGTVPADNPFPGSPVYSLGHRNVQGLAFDETGQLWASEFGAKDVDEINRISAGANYGWPIVEGPGGGEGLVDPQAAFSPTSTASPSGLIYARGSLWVASLRGRTLYQVPLSDGAAGQPVGHFTGAFGRLRDVVAGPDGALWLLTNNTDGRGDPRPDDDRIIEVALRPVP